MIYHIVLVFYLLVLMLRTLSMTAHGAGYLQAQGERVLPLLRLLMTALLAEKLIRRRAAALPAALLAAAGWVVGDEELLDLCLLTAVSDLARERKTLRVMLWTCLIGPTSHCIMSAMCTAMSPTRLPSNFGSTNQVAPGDQPTSGLFRIVR